VDARIPATALIVLSHVAGLDAGTGTGGRKDVLMTSNPSPRAWLAVATVAATAVLGAQSAVPVLIRSGSFPSEIADEAAAIRDPPVMAALEAGERALRNREYDIALDSFKKANKLQGGTSPVAMFEISRAYRALNAFKNEADTCLEALKYAGQHSHLAAVLHNQLGLALQSLADKHVSGSLEDAEREFRAAIASSGTFAQAQYNLGVVLLKQRRDEEGKAVLTTYAGMRGMANADAVRRLIDNPRRARENFAPDFRLTTLEGEYLQSEEFTGRTVLLDFWGAWCAPCRAATPELVKLQKKYGASAFLLLGISSDPPADEQKVRDYVAEYKMVWPQNIDATRTIHNAFEVRTFPTYIVLDADGIIRERVQGWGPATIGRLEAAIRTSLKDGFPKN
jgi:thiol-disulfide isomerase/thioredoxin